MDSIFDAIGPVLFVIIYVVIMVIKKFSKGGENEDAAPAGDEVDRTREIQAEIRRRILERQQEHGGAGGTVVAPPQQAAPEPAPQVFQMPQASTEDSLGQEQIERGIEERSAAVAAAQSQRDAQMRRIRADHDHSGNLRKRAAVGAANRTRAANQQQRARVRARWAKTFDVAAMAEDPTALRKAFVTMEVLGAPVAMRKDNSVMRFWEQ